MAFKRIFLVLLLSAIALARPDGPGSPNRADKPEGKKGPGGAPEGPHFSRPLPPFIANLSMEAKIEFDSVFKNKSLTLAQIDAQDALLVEKYGVAVSLIQFSKISEHTKKIPVTTLNFRQFTKNSKLM